MIITENVKDFYFSEIPVHTSKDFILNVLWFFERTRIWWIGHGCCLIIFLDVHNVRVFCVLYQYANQPKILHKNKSRKYHFLA
jgi:hypothetical protein